MENYIPRDVAGLSLPATVATVDTIELFMRHPPSGLRGRIELVTGRRAHIQDCRDATERLRGARAIFNRPCRDTVELIGQIMRTERGSTICRADIALDFYCASEDAAEALVDWLDRHLLLKWRSPRAAKKRVRETVYWADKKRSRNLVAYRRRTAKPVIRLELRFMNSGAVRRAGLDEPEGLRRASPAKIIGHNIKAVKPTEKYILRTARKTFQEDMRSARRNDHALSDYYRSRIPQRVRSILKRADAQSLRIRASGVERISIDHAIPDQITWPALRDKGNLGKRTQSGGLLRRGS